MLCQLSSQRPSASLSFSRVLVWMAEQSGGVEKGGGRESSYFGNLAGWLERANTSDVIPWQGLIARAHIKT